MAPPLMRVPGGEVVDRRDVAPAAADRVEERCAGLGVGRSRERGIARRRLGRAHELGEELDVDTDVVADAGASRIVGRIERGHGGPFEVFSFGWSGLVMPISFR